MRLFEVMTTSVETIPPAMDAGDAWELMRRRRIRHLVVTRGATVVGVLSDRDLGSRAGARIRVGRNVAELMTSHAVTMSPDDTVRHAANVTRGRTIGCVPVVTGERLVGIVTTAKLLGLLGGGVETSAKSGRRSGSRLAPHRKDRRLPASY
jgi:acetoin utilization protein AcuB